MKRWFLPLLFLAAIGCGNSKPTAPNQDVAIYESPFANKVFYRVRLTVYRNTDNVTQTDTIAGISYWGFSDSTFEYKTVIDRGQTARMAKLGFPFHTRYTYEIYGDSWDAVPSDPYTGKLYMHRESGSGLNMGTAQFDDIGEGLIVIEYILVQDVAVLNGEVLTAIPADSIDAIIADRWDARGGF